MVSASLPRTRDCSFVVSLRLPLSDGDTKGCPMTGLWFLPPGETASRPRHPPACTATRRRDAGQRGPCTRPACEVCRLPPGPRPDWGPARRRGRGHCRGDSSPSAAWPQRGPGWARSGPLLSGSGLLPRYGASSLSPAGTRGEGKEEPRHLRLLLSLWAAWGAPPVRPDRSPALSSSGR